MRKGLVLAFALVAALPASAQDKKVPYWASIASGEANMRTGPGKTYPTTWAYQRRDLPVRVNQRYDNWRRVEGPAGAEGWMAVALLSERRTALVKGQGSTPVDVHVEPDAASRVAYRAEPGVVGRIEACNGEWCRMVFQLGKKQRGGGWIREESLWGVDPGEVIED